MGEKGRCDALKQAGFPAESLTILAPRTPEAAALIECGFGPPADRLELAGGRGRRRARPALRGAPGAGARPRASWTAGTMRRVGFQPHDGRIFETLVGRGGVLVAIHSEPRAADALASCIRTAAATRRSAPGPAASNGTGHVPASPPAFVLRNGSRSRHSFSVASPETRARQYLHEQSAAFPMAETTRRADVRLNASAGHLSVHFEERHPAEVPFLFEQQQKRLGPGRGRVSRLAHRVRRCSSSSSSATARAHRARRPCLPEQPNENIVWLERPGRAAAVAAAATR